MDHQDFTVQHAEPAFVEEVNEVRANTILDHSWVDAEPLTFMYATHKSHRISCFFRGRVKIKKPDILDNPYINGPKMIHFFATKF